MSNNYKPVGGRGKTAPYETTLMRIPLPLKGKVTELVDEYRRQLFESKDIQGELFDFEVNDQKTNS